MQEGSSGYGRIGLILQHRACPSAWLSGPEYVVKPQSPPPLPLSDLALAGNPWEPHEVSFQIYNVELVGQRLNAKLRAGHMTTIRYSSLGHHKIATLDGEHFLEIRKGTVL